MKPPPFLAIALRRTLVTVGVAGSLIVGAVTVQAAAAWTASSAPLTAAPVSTADLITLLTDEQARTAALEQQIADLTARTTGLASALDSASKRVVTDSGTAKVLRAQLAAAQKKLAAVTQALQAANLAPASGASGAAPPPAPANGPGGDD